MATSISLMGLQRESNKGTSTASIAKRVEYLVATLVVPGSIPGGSIEVLGELNPGDRI